MNRAGLSSGLVLAACIAAIAASPATAFTEFRAEKAPLVTKDHNKGVHRFTIPASPAPVECETVNSKGKISDTKSPSVREKVEYTKCVAFNAGAATVSPSEYEFNASGTVSILATVLIKVPAASCEVEVPSKSNQSLPTVTYTAVGTKTTAEIEIKSNLTGVTATILKGTACGKSGNEAGYEGTSIVEGFETNEKGHIGIIIV